MLTHFFSYPCGLIPMRRPTRDEENRHLLQCDSAACQAAGAKMLREAACFREAGARITLPTRKETA